MDTITLDSFFESSEIESDYLKSLLEKVLAIINKPDLCFGKIYEGRIFGNPGVVTWDGEIYLDSKRLQQYDDQIAMAIIGHELAHYHMGHYNVKRDILK
jgi:predicted SprT family Zn-dependent metalloprotease